MKKVLVNEELLRQVLDALEAADKRDGVYSYRCEINALRAALDAEPAPTERTVQEPVAWRLKDEEASAHYSKPVYAYYDAADIRLDHPDAAKLTALLEPLFLHSTCVLRLPDDWYPESKDWRESPGERGEWLRMMYEQAKSELFQLRAELDKQMGGNVTNDVTTRT